CFLIGLALELAPMVSILVNSFIKTSTGQFTLENYAGIFSFDSITYVNASIPRAILNTFLFAIGGACFATILAIITVTVLGKHRKEKKSVSYEMISYLPLAVSSMTISLGIYRIFGNSQFFINYPWIFIIISHGLLGYPFITRALMNGLNTIDPEMEASAKTLGANWWYKFRKIYVPLLIPSLIAGLAFAIGLSIGEFTIANFFYLSDNSIATLTVALFKLRSARQFGLSSAVGAILLIMSYMSFFAIEIVGGRVKTSSK
ncbi:MAG: ABC transporter permease, partial [Candidatus Heimdallarchaeota archaeon]